MMWGSNVPQTRTPDAHFMTEARYKGAKVVVVSPDYSEASKFADLWLHPKQGTDAALSMAIGHVILKEFHVERQSPYFNQYVRENTDLPFLVLLKEQGDCYVQDRFLRASDSWVSWVKTIIRTGKQSLTTNLMVRLYRLAALSGSAGARMVIGILSKKPQTVRRCNYV